MRPFSIIYIAVVASFVVYAFFAARSNLGRRMRLVPLMWIWLGVVSAASAVMVAVHIRTVPNWLFGPSILINGLFVALASRDKANQGGTDR